MAEAGSPNNGVRAPERLTVEHAADLLDQMQRFVLDHDTMQVDLSPVVSVDTAGLQLLTVVSCALERGSKSIGFSGAPDCVIEAAGLLGVEHHLELR